MQLNVNDSKASLIDLSATEKQLISSAVSLHYTHTHTLFADLKDNKCGYCSSCALSVKPPNKRFIIWLLNFPISKNLFFSKGWFSPGQRLVLGQLGIQKSIYKYWLGVPSEECLGKRLEWRFTVFPWHLSAFKGEHVNMNKYSLIFSVLLAAGNFRKRNVIPRTCWLLFCDLSENPADFISYPQTTIF